jgi:hypothetical protein
MSLIQIFHFQIFSKNFQTCVSIPSIQTVIKGQTRVRLFNAFNLLLLPTLYTTHLHTPNLCKFMYSRRGEKEETLRNFGKGRKRMHAKLGELVFLSFWVDAPWIGAKFAIFWCDCWGVF